MCITKCENLLPMLRSRVMFTLSSVESNKFHTKFNMIRSVRFEYGIQSGVFVFSIKKVLKNKYLYIQLTCLPNYAVQITMCKIEKQFLVYVCHGYIFLTKK